MLPWAHGSWLMALCLRLRLRQCAVAKVDTIRQQCLKLGAGDMYPLLAGLLH